jgi:hypothetical protein
VPPTAPPDPLVPPNVPPEPPAPPTPGWPAVASSVVSGEHPARENAIAAEKTVKLGIVREPVMEKTSC